MVQVASQPAAAFHGTQEVRFAVVLYGGVSLAIYINGVTQELFELVRATAPDGPGTGLRFPTPALRGAGAVYRTLGQLLGDPPLALAECTAHHPARTRFVIDVLSGTSAGGINGIVLAKALANAQDIQQLQTLWVTEGDIATLINDQHSLDGLSDSGLDLQPTPQSLLNSQRLYLKLLEAIDGMEQLPLTQPSPYVDELDLYVTATDLEGLVLPIKLADKVVTERRHRNVFHFLYAKEEASGTDRNDFEASNNPLLAFAARCTSAFPFAFEPMALEDIKALPPYRGDATKFNAARKAWRKFYRDYQPDDFVHRAFGDGGYLDNKPFSYTTDTLLRRRADVRVRRTLIYVEPSPEHLTAASPAAQKPDAISNVVKAVVTLPGYETIREDIQRVRDRNRLITRAKRITDSVDADVAAGTRAGLVRQKSAGGDLYARKDLPDMIAIKGVSYGGYHRLKVAALTDELAALITRLAGSSETSDAFLAVRYLVGAWRDAAYVEAYPRLPGGGRDESRPSQNRLLVDFDLSYRLRRINFLRAKIDEYLGLDRPGLRRATDAIGRANTIDQSQFDLDTFRAALRDMRRDLSQVFVALRRLGRTLRARDADGRALATLVRATGIGAVTVEQLLAAPGDTQRRQVAAWLVLDPDIRAHLTDIACALLLALRPATEQAAADCRATLQPAAPASLSAAIAANCLWHYYEHYDDYDMITFPITYGTGVGEAAMVDIIRISPEDATSLLDERAAHPKLAGSTVFHFGGFLDPLWRRNDMLWGRLDGAERLITALLPERPHDAARLVTQAHEAILTEERARPDIDAAYRDIVDGILARLRRGSPIANIRETHPPDREKLLRVTARATTVIGKLLEGLTSRYHTAGRRAAAWITRLGSVLWGLVEVAVPRSLWSEGFRYWLQLLYLFEAFVFASGLLFGARAVQNVGLAALGVTLIINLAVLVTGEWMRATATRRCWRWPAMVGAGALVVLVILGVVEVGQLLALARDCLASWLTGKAAQ